MSGSSPYTYRYRGACGGAYGGACACAWGTTCAGPCTGASLATLLMLALCPHGPYYAPYASDGIIATYPPSPTPSSSLYAFSIGGGAQSTISMIF